METGGCDGSCVLCGLGTCGCAMGFGAADSGMAAILDIQFDPMQTLPEGLRHDLLLSGPDVPPHHPHAPPPSLASSVSESSGPPSVVMDLEHLADLKEEPDELHLPHHQPHPHHPLAGSPLLLEAALHGPVPSPSSSSSTSSPADGVGFALPPCGWMSLPLVNESGAFCPEAARALQALGGSPLQLVVLTGPARAGKSFIGSRLVEGMLGGAPLRPAPFLHRVGPGPVTRGVTVCIVRRPYGHMLVMDTEGYGCLGQADEQEHAMAILGLGTHIIHVEQGQAFNVHYLRQLSAKMVSAAERRPRAIGPRVSLVLNRTDFVLNEADHVQRLCDAGLFAFAAAVRVFSVFQCDEALAAGPDPAGPLAGLCDAVLQTPSLREDGVETGRDILVHIQGMFSPSRESGYDTHDKPLPSFLLPQPGAGAGADAGVGVGVRRGRRTRARSSSASSSATSTGRASTASPGAAAMATTPPAATSASASMGDALPVPVFRLPGRRRGTLHELLVLSGREGEGEGGGLGPPSLESVCLAIQGEYPCQVVAGRWCVDQLLPLTLRLRPDAGIDCFGSRGYFQLRIHRRDTVFFGNRRSFAEVDDGSAIKVGLRPKFTADNQRKGVNPKFTIDGECSVFIVLGFDDHAATLCSAELQLELVHCARCRSTFGQRSLYKADGRGRYYCEKHVPRTVTIAAGESRTEQVMVEPRTSKLTAKSATELVEGWIREAGVLCRRDSKSSLRILRSGSRAAREAFPLAVDAVLEHDGVSSLTRPSPSLEAIREGLAAAAAAVDDGARFTAEVYIPSGSMAQAEQVLQQLQRSEFGIAHFRRGSLRLKLYAREQDGPLDGAHVRERLVRLLRTTSLAGAELSVVPEERAFDRALALAPLDVHSVLRAADRIPVVVKVPAEDLLHMGAITAALQDLLSQGFASQGFAALHLLAVDVRKALLSFEAVFDAPCLRTARDLDALLAAIPYTASLAQLHPAEEQPFSSDEESESSDEEGDPLVVAPEPDDEPGPPSVVMPPAAVAVPIVVAAAAATALLSSPPPTPAAASEEGKGGEGATAAATDTPISARASNEGSAARYRSPSLDSGLGTDGNPAMASQHGDPAPHRRQPSPLQMQEEDPPSLRQQQQPQQPFQRRRHSHPPAQPKPRTQAHRRSAQEPGRERQPEAEREPRAPMQEVLAMPVRSAKLKFSHANRNLVFQAEESLRCAAEIDLTGCDLGDDGIRRVASSLKLNGALTRLGLMGNAITCKGLRSLCEALQSTACLERLDLRHNHLADAGARALSAQLARQERLTSLELGHNELGPGGAAALADGVRRLPALAVLDVAHNEIEDVGAALLVGALAGHEALRELNLGATDLSDASAEALSHLLVRCPGLTSVTLSGNPRLTDACAQRLLAVVPALPRLRTVAVAGSGVSRAVEARLAGLTRTKPRHLPVSLFLLGYGCVGKSELARALQRKGQIFSLWDGARVDPPMTEKITQVRVRLDAATELLITDCGGQQFYHSVNTRALVEHGDLFAIVLNPLEDWRERGATLEQARYWLRLLASTGQSLEHILLVFTHRDLVPTKEATAEAVERLIRNTLLQVKREFDLPADTVAYWEVSHDPKEHLCAALCRTASRLRRPTKLDAAQLVKAYRRHPAYRPLLPWASFAAILRGILGFAASDEAIALLLAQLVKTGLLLRLGTAAAQPGAPEQEFEAAAAAAARAPAAGFCEPLLMPALVCGDAEYLHSCLARIMDIERLAVAGGGEGEGEGGASAGYGRAWFPAGRLMTLRRTHRGLRDLELEQLQVVFEHFGLGYPCLLSNPADAGRLQRGLVVLPMLTTRLLDALPDPVWTDTSATLGACFRVGDDKSLLPPTFLPSVIIRLKSRLPDWGFAPHADGCVLTSPGQDVRIYVYVPGSLLPTTVRSVPGSIWARLGLVAKRREALRSVCRAQGREVGRMQQLEVYGCGDEAMLHSALRYVRMYVEAVRERECPRVRLLEVAQPARVSKFWYAKGVAIRPTVATLRGTARPAVVELDARDLAIDHGAVLGAGSFGVVYRGSLKGAPVAIKTWKPLAGAPAGPTAARIQKELRTCSELEHPCILRFFGAVFEGGAPACLVSELMPRGSLAGFLAADGYRLKPAQALGFAGDVLRALVYLHGKQLIHLDVKPGNILLHDERRCVLGDFGLSRALDPGFYEGPSTAGTKLYKAPELECFDQFCEKVDLWSFGVVLVELCLGPLKRKPGPPERRRADALCPPLAPLVRECLVTKAQDRCSARRALSLLTGDAPPGEPAGEPAPRRGD